jgi:hypothetical protein
MALVYNHRRYSTYDFDELRDDADVDDDDDDAELELDDPRFGFTRDE